MAAKIGLERPDGTVTDIMNPSAINQAAIEARSAEGTLVNFNAEPAVLDAGGPYIVVAGELQRNTSAADAALLKEQRLEIAALKSQEAGLQQAALDPDFNHLDFSAEQAEVTAALAALVTATGG